MKIGYARILTEDQSLDLQRDKLARAGCTELFEDRGLSRASTRRPGLDASLKKIAYGDVLVVWKLDRLGRLLPHLIETVRQLGDAGGDFASLSENIDTTEAGGKLVFHIMGALAEFKQSLIVERVNAGIASAWKRGRHIGRPRKLTPEQITHARNAIDSGMQTCGGMAALLGVDHSTLWRAMRAANDAVPAALSGNAVSARRVEGSHHGQH